MSYNFINLTFHTVLDVFYTTVITVHIQKLLLLKIGRELIFRGVLHCRPCVQMKTVHTRSTSVTKSRCAHTPNASLDRYCKVAWRTIRESKKRTVFNFRAFPKTAVLQTLPVFLRTFCKVFCSSQIFSTSNSKWALFTVRESEPERPLKLRFFSKNERLRKLV